MSEPLADTAHYEALHGPATDPQRLAALLAKASRIIRAEAARAGVDVDVDKRITDGALDPDLAADIACDMAHWALTSGPVDGATAITQTTGPFTVNATLSSPSGTMILTRAHRRLLGIPPQTAWQADLLTGRG
ncbi:MAG: Gp19/Gp15/Gp42 family protein [Propionibacterium acidifaciens]|uniref:Gp19/Gp15/Gp42 family protein n=1 Tax=Propionibacterium acidifaciens TaxID=556499 RepID=UPI0036126F96